jgi:hypothetical protein
MAKWTLSSSEPIQHESRRLVRNTETGQEGFASVGRRDGHPFLFGAVTRPHLDSNGMETGDSTTLDGDPEFA